MVLLCVGLLVVGPVVAVVGAVGAGYVAATHGGEAGEVARATGRAATTAYTKAKEYDREHHVSTTPWKPHMRCPSEPSPSLLALPLWMCVWCAGVGACQGGGHGGRTQGTGLQREAPREQPSPSCAVCVLPVC